MTWEELLRLVREGVAKDTVVDRASATVQAYLPEVPKTYRDAAGRTKTIVYGGVTIRLLNVTEAVMLQFEEAVQ